MLNQGWLLISEVLWHSPENIFKLSLHLPGVIELIYCPFHFEELYSPQNLQEAPTTIISQEDCQQAWEDGVDARAHVCVRNGITGACVVSLQTKLLNTLRPSDAHMRR